MDAIGKLIAAIERDIEDRRGLKHEWNGIDESVKGEIRVAWRKLIEQYLPVAVARNLRTGRALQSLDCLDGVFAAGAGPVNKYYEIRFRREGSPRRWLRIGSATGTESDFGPIILCTIEAVPLNWDGTFMLAESKEPRAKRYSKKSSKEVNAHGHPAPPALPQDGGRVTEAAGPRPEAARREAREDGRASPAEVPRDREEGGGGLRAGEASGVEEVHGDDGSGEGSSQAGS